MIPPLCGDGMSMALRSAALCVPLADRYLRGQSSLVQWQQDYARFITEEFRGPLRWGGLLQRVVEMPALAACLPHAARLAPGAARALVQATRLKPFPM
jgi:flavin-dependent dehydrogenase